MIVIGLTGAMGAGKSTTAKMFRERGIPVHSADETVHRLYVPEGAGARAVAKLAPEAIAPDGSVDRSALRRKIVGDPKLWKRLEKKIHPLVAADRNAFLERERSIGRSVVVVDVPLLFETRGDRNVDIVVVASAPFDIQQQRLRKRGIPPEELWPLLARQLPDHEQRQRADYVVNTGMGMAEARRQVKAILDGLYDW